MKTITITVSEELHQILEIRAAIDDLKVADGVANLLNDLVAMWQAGRATCASNV